MKVDRISIEHGDKGFGINGWRDARVFFNGVEQKMCVTACVSEGFIRRYETDQFGNLRWNSNNTEPVIETVMGEVEIVLPELKMPELIVEEEPYSDTPAGRAKWLVKNYCQSMSYEDQASLRDAIEHEIMNYGNEQYSEGAASDSNWRTNRD